MLLLFFEHFKKLELFKQFYSKNNFSKNENEKTQFFIKAINIIKYTRESIYYRYFIFF